MLTISAGFSPSRPVSCAEGRRGQLIITQEGRAPAVWMGSGAAFAAGMPPPAAAPAISVSESVAYYIARTDVAKPGAVYYAPPVVSYSFNCTADLAKFRPAKAKSYLESAALSEIVMEDGGKYYPCEPTAALSPTHGSGASFAVSLDAPAVYSGDPGNSAETGLSGFLFVSDGPPWPDEQALPDDARPAEYAIWEYVDIPIAGNGIQRVNGPRRWFFVQNQCTGNSSRYFLEYATDVEVAGYTTGSGAVVRVFGSGHQYLGASCQCLGSVSSFCYFNFVPATGYGGAAAHKLGKDYDKDAEIYIAIPAASVYDTDRNQTVPYDYTAQDTKTVNALHWQKAMVIRLYAGNDPRSPGGGVGWPIKDISVSGGGSGYLVAPQVKIVSSTGFGAYATCEVNGGAISSVTLENGGGGYKTKPEVKLLAGGAEAFAVARPHLRGVYQCYYRYTDDTQSARGGPVPSNLSPVLELDAGEGAAFATWSVAAPSYARATHVELWRSTSGQATTVYRVARLPIGDVPEGGFVDDLTDEELRDPDRPGYEALPILLPNGELNAMRFVPPTADKSSVVWFQDRMWYGVGGENANAVYYSEVDEPESVPGENEIVVQQNGRSHDVLRAMIPFGSTLFLAQERHLFSLSFSQIPVLDGQVSAAAYRGCLNQRCWQIHEGLAYVLDRYGLYRINQAGAVEDLSEPVRDQFEGKIDLRDARWSFVAVDFSTRTVRAFVSHKDDGADQYPTRALCCDVDSKAVWWEKYPQRITASTTALLSSGDMTSLYAGSGGAYVLDSGRLDLGRGSIVKVSLLARGKGYRHPPIVTASGGTGAALQASLNAAGEISAIWIRDPGYGYSGGALVIGPPDDPSIPPSERVQARAVCQATPLASDTPLYPTFRFRTGCVEYPSDADSKDGGTTGRRDMRLYYHPTKTSNEVSVRMYYNNSQHPRPNIAERDRGVGFVDSTVDPAARLDLGYLTSTYGDDSGAARSIRTGKSLEDIRSGDRDVSVEVCGPSRDTTPITLYGLEVFGGAS